MRARESESEKSSLAAHAIRAWLHGGVSSLFELLFRFSLRRPNIIAMD